jgi:cytoskeletal protein RodZ
MPRPNAPVSLVDLGAAGVRLRPYEAVTVVRELAQQVVRGQIAGVPSAHVVRLSTNGSVSVEGPVAAGGRPVVRAAQLLESLLPPADAGSDFRVPGALKLVIARALGTIDLPPFGSLEALVDALERFAATDPAAAIASVAVSCIEAAGARPADTATPPPPVVVAQVQPFVGMRASDARPQPSAQSLTISDIRRARRATGLPLTRVSERSRIPIGLLRQLEWGYFFNWPRGRYGRAQLVRYARAAGLDEELVVSTVTPLIDQAEPLPADPQKAAEPATLIPRPSADLQLRPAAEPAALPVLFASSQPVAHRRRKGVVTALAAAAALTVIVAPMWWDYQGHQPVPAAQTAQQESQPQPVSSAGADNPTAPAAAPARSTPPEATEVAIGTASATGTTGVDRVPRNAPDAQTAAIGAPVSDGEYLLAADRSALAPSFASPGTAMFYRADGSAASRGETEGDGSVLRITRIVDDSAKNFHVRPSPDGSRIAFDSNRDGVRGIYVADGDGQNVRRVSGPGFAAMPSWSPDGRTLAFVRAEEGSPQVWNLWTLQLDSGQTRQITNLRDGQPWGGSWFPDGRRLAYGSGERLVIRDLESGAERVFSTPVKGRAVRTPAVSPDGRRIVFQVARDGAWLLELPGGAVRRVLEDPTAEEYTWSPDGHRLAYHSRRTGTWGVWVMASR